MAERDEIPRVIEPDVVAVVWFAVMYIHGRFPARSPIAAPWAARLLHEDGRSELPPSWVAIELAFLGIGPIALLRTMPIAVAPAHDDGAARSVAILHQESPVRRALRASSLVRRIMFRKRSTLSGVISTGGNDTAVRPSSRKQC